MSPPPTEPRKPREWMKEPSEFGDFPHGKFDENIAAATTDERARLSAAKVQDRFAWEVKRHIGGSHAKHRTLARQLGYNKPDTLRATLRGETQISLKAMFEIAEILKIPLAVIIRDKTLP